MKRTFPERDLPAMLDALADAIDYRLEHRDEWCGNCEPAQDGKPVMLCGDHENDEAAAANYVSLHDRLRGDRLRSEIQGGSVNDGLLGGLWAFLAPAGWATEWYFPEGYHGKVWNLFHGQGWRAGLAPAPRHGQAGQLCGPNCFTRKAS
jgi:hypothetical protein